MKFTKYNVEIEEWNGAKSTWRVETLTASNAMCEAIRLATEDKRRVMGAKILEPRDSTMTIILEDEK
jgi:hypothetical protein